MLTTFSKLFINNLLFFRNYKVIHPQMIYLRIFLIVEFMTKFYLHISFLVQIGYSHSSPYTSQCFPLCICVRVQYIPRIKFFILKQ